MDHLRTTAWGKARVGLLERTPRTATVTTLETCRLLRLPGAVFLEALASTPPTGEFIETARAEV